MKYLVFDVGISAIKYALMNDVYELLEKDSVPTPLDALDSFKKAIHDIYVKYQDEVEGIAISLPGMINKKTNKMQIPGFLLYNDGVDIEAELKSVTTNQLTIANDAKCAALCEVTLGSLKDTGVGAVCIIGSGIGGAVTIGNNVLTGVHGFAGEFSYLSSDWKNCCGFNEKWGAVNSVYALIANVAAKKQLDKDQLDGKAVFELCNQKDEVALSCLKEFTDYLAAGLYNLQACVDPEKIAIGGGISKQPILFEYIQKSLDEIYAAIPFNIPRVQIVNCKYFNDSNLMGALANYKLIMKE
ncbi:ROK family protein [[Eubacterium] hominis]|uniref:ROK family protein n=1 Tax=[Eubacterium] hominis TaxID=2764325 RepID=UPI0022E34ECB